MPRFQTSLQVFLIFCLGISALGPIQSNTSTLRKAALRSMRQQAPTYQPVIKECDWNHILLEFKVPTYWFETVSSDGRDYQQIHFPGNRWTEESGKPQLPMVSVLVGIPGTAELDLQTVLDDAESLPGIYLLPPAASPVADSQDLVPGRWVLSPDEQAFTSRKPYPDAPVTLNGDAWLRDQRVVRLSFYPFQYSALSGQLTWHRRLMVDLKFAYPQGKLPAGTSGEPPVNPRKSFYEAALRQTLLNYEAAREWRVANPTAVIRDQPFPSIQLMPGKPYLKIAIDQDGIYRLSYDDLNAAGMNLDQVNPVNFHLTSQGAEVAFRLEADGDSIFEPGEALLFYGEQFRGDRLAALYANEMKDWLALCPKCSLKGMLEKYTDENIYWLSIETTPGLQMSTLDGTPHDLYPTPAYFTSTLHVEESHWWFSYHFTNEDTWFWDSIQTGGTATRHYPFSIEGLSSEPISATVRASIVSRTSQSGHHTIFMLNNDPTPLDDSIWDGMSRHSFEAQVPSGKIHAGANQLDLQVSAGANGEWIYFDWLEVEYARRFDASGGSLTFAAPMTGTLQYQVDHLITSTVYVLDTTNPFAPLRIINPRVLPNANGYQVEFQVDPNAASSYLVTDAAGLRQPNSIELYVPPNLDPPGGADYVIITHDKFTFTAAALANYHTAQGLRTVMVKIEDLYNQFNFGIFHPVAIRLFLKHAFASWQGPPPEYAVLIGDGNFNFKDFDSVYGSEPNYIPPNLAFIDPWQGETDSTNLLASVVGDDILPDVAIGRIPVSETSQLSRLINRIVSYGAQRGQDWQRRILFITDNIPDPAGNFEAIANSVVQKHIPSWYETEVLRLTDICGPPASPPIHCQAANHLITETINITTPLLVNYIGHASVDLWAGETVFRNRDIPALTNAGRLPVVISMDCLDGFWMFPNSYRSSLIEELLRAPDGGAVAAFAPTGLGVATGHEVLHRGFYDSLMGGEPHLGPSTVAAKVALYAVGVSLDLIQTFTVFGDPALEIPLANPGNFLPLIIH